MKKIVTHQKENTKYWVLYFLCILLLNFLHELGHCVPAWTNGYKAVPTPMKEYTLDAIPASLTSIISFGGVFVSVASALVIQLVYAYKPGKYTAAILAASLAMPGIYTVRFVLAGRGHDATEFQEAQSVAGFAYAGHAVDIVFLALLISGTVLWIVQSKPRFSVAGKLLAGILLTLVFIVLLQKGNNLIFDPLFR